MKEAAYGYSQLSRLNDRGGIWRSLAAKTTRRHGITKGHCKASD